MTPTSLPVLFVIGDSISMQYGLSLQPFLADDFEYRTKKSGGNALANLDVPQGNNGGDSQMVLDYLTALKKHDGLHADFMLLNCGLHDIKRDPTTNQLAISISQYEQNLQAIVGLVHAANIKLAWVNTTASVDAVHNKPNMSFFRYAKDNDAYHAIAIKVMGQHKVPTIDLRSFTNALGGDEVFRDHVHHHDHVGRCQAAYIAGWIKAHTAS